MFTGIIEAIGTIGAMERKGDDIRLYVRSGKLDLSDVALGDSIATNGVCLTVVDLPGDGYWADVSAETVACTSLSGLTNGSKVNLELALTPTTRLGGHMVSGHVDGVGEVIDRYDEGKSVRFIIKPPQDIAKYIAAKGSITVDGVSLTVNDISNQASGSTFTLNIVPHTIEETIISEYRIGSKINLEVDLIARYLEQLLLGNKNDEVATAKSTSNITESFLAENGFK